MTPLIVIIVSSVLIGTILYVLNKTRKRFDERSFMRIAYVLPFTVAVVSTIVLLFWLAPSFFAWLNAPTAEEQQTQALLSQTYGSWVSADNSLRIHFFSVDESLAPNVVFANLETGTAQADQYLGSKQNDNVLEFHILTKDTGSDNQSLNNWLPSEFSVTEIGVDSLVLNIRDKPPLRYIKTNHPNSAEELAGYSSTYSVEEYVSVIAAGFSPLEWDVSTMISKKNSGGKYGIFIDNVPMDWDHSWLSGGGPLIPGSRAPEVIPPLRSLLLPISDKIEFISYTERWLGNVPSDDPLLEAHWTAIYTVSSSSYQLLEDTATGKEVAVEYR